MPYLKATLLVVTIFSVIVVGCRPAENLPDNNLNNETTNKKEAHHMIEISGKFDVNITPTETNDPKLGMMLLDKQYHGALDATGKGRMLTGMTEIQGSAGYVAIEKVSGSLKEPNGTSLRGSFLIQHFGVQQGETKRLSVEIIPDSGTEDLVGIEGKMEIDIADGDHLYRLHYKLPLK